MHCALVRSLYSDWQRLKVHAASLIEMEDAWCMGICLWGLGGVPTPSSQTSGAGHCWRQDAEFDGPQI